MKAAVLASPGVGGPGLGRLLSCFVAELGWVLDLFVAGSLATGDYVLGVSDLDLVALTARPTDELRQAILTQLHQT